MNNVHTSLHFTFKTKPLSVNHAFIFRGRFKIPTKEHKEYKEFIKSEILKNKESVRFFKNNSNPMAPINVKINFFLSRHLTKKKEISLKGNDLDNLNKITIDAIFDTLEINDAYICDLHVTKSQSNTDYFTVSISRELLISQ